MYIPVRSFAIVVGVLVSVGPYGDFSTLEVVAGGAVGFEAQYVSPYVVEWIFHFYSSGFNLIFAAMAWASSPSAVAIVTIAGVSPANPSDVSC